MVDQECTQNQSITYDNGRKCKEISQLIKSRMKMLIIE